MKGFTLIELIVTVAVGLVVTGLIVANYNSYNTVAALKQAALTVKNDIRFVANKALTGEKPSDVACTPLTGWNITFAATSYSYRPICNGVPSGSATTVQIPPGISITTLPSPNPVSFFVLTRGTNLATDQTIVLTGSGKTYRMDMSVSGEVSDRGIQ